MGLFDLNFCMTDHLHDIMHGQNRIDRMINGTSSSDPQSPQRGELFHTSVQSFDRTPFRAVSFFEFIGRFELSTVPSPQIRIRILELAILFPANSNPFIRKQPQITFGSAVSIHRIAKILSFFRFSVLHFNENRL